MARFSIQFGSNQPGKTYKERPSVYGICQGELRKIAIIKIGSRDNYHYDLPGGGVETMEAEPEALIREFEEEAGLDIWPIRVLGRAGQFWINGDKPLNSLASFYEVEITGDPSKPTEPDHTLIWMTPDEAIKNVRHESHAWAIMKWERERFKDGQV